MGSSSASSWAGATCSSQCSYAYDDFSYSEVDTDLDNAAAAPPPPLIGGGGGDDHHFSSDFFDFSFEPDDRHFSENYSLYEMNCGDICQEEGKGDNHHEDGDDQTSQNNVVASAGQSICSLPEKDIDEEDDLQSLPLSSMCRVDKLNLNNSKVNCGSSQTGHSYKMTEPYGNVLALNSFGMVAGKSTSNFPEEDIYEENAHPDDKLEPQTYKGKGKCQNSQSCPLKTAKHLENALVSNSNGMIGCKSISNLFEKDISKEDVLSSSPLSTCRDVNLECNTNKKKCQRYHRNHSSEMLKTSEVTLVSSFDGIITRQSICTFSEGGIIQKDAPPAVALSAHGDEELASGNGTMKFQGSQSNNSSKKMKPLDGTIISNSNEMVLGESISNLPEKGMIEEHAIPDSTQPRHGDEKLEPDHCKRKYQGSESNYPSKAKRTSDNMSLSSSAVVITSNDIATFPDEHSNDKIAQPDSSLSMSGAGVKLRIKSFTVPEFLVEVPETATVSFLKRTIVEKATGIVEGGVHVGILLQGEEIREENRTLSETGISHESKLDVILEPKFSQARLCSCPHCCLLHLPCNIPQPIKRHSCTPAVVHQGTSDNSIDPLLCNSANIIGGDHDLVQFHTTTPVEVIAIPALSVEPVDLAPVHQKCNSSKDVQRRKSELFSISEVEALVLAVEKLGTGRWKKIEEEAFGNSSNRTHADLKDKWRSLVKTAKRPATKRRGVVLPQELLNRVLAVENRNSEQRTMHH